MQGDHSPGKDGKVGELKTGRWNVQVGEISQVCGNSGKF